MICVVRVDTQLELKQIKSSHQPTKYEQVGRLILRMVLGTTAMMNSELSCALSAVYPSG